MNSRTSLKKTLLLCGLTLCMTGCTKDRVIRHPDAPMVILSGSGKAKVMIYDRQENTLVDGGKVRIQDLRGWTIMRGDWEPILNRNNDDGN